MEKMQSTKSVLLNFKDFYQLQSNNSVESPKTVIAEIAGKDSIAAIIQVAKNTRITKLLGIGINHRSFYGNIDEPLEHFEYITKNKEEISVATTHFIYLDVSKLFDLLLVRTMATVQKYFQYYSPCPACHLFFHMMRVPIARFFKISNFISGERDFHGNRIKLNQLPEVLTLLKRLLKREGIELLQPLKFITEDKEIFKLLGPKWISAAPYKCSFSGNYYDEDGKIPHKTQDVLDALEKFYYPLFHEIIRYIENNEQEPNEKWIKTEIKKIITNF